MIVILCYVYVKYLAYVPLLEPHIRYSSLNLLLVRQQDIYTCKRLYSITTTDICWNANLLRNAERDLCTFLNLLVIGTCVLIHINICLLLVAILMIQSFKEYDTQKLQKCLCKCSSFVNL